MPYCCSSSFLGKKLIIHIDYIDEYGINHGKGIAIANKIWAPVNCGYHESDFPYGKLYQWGRKYGQGLGEGYDSAINEIVEGPVSLSAGQDVTNQDKIYKTLEDWTSPSVDNLWNDGTSDNPIKTIYDPCPAGWRVPTIDELRQGLVFKRFMKSINRSQLEQYNGVSGYWVSGIYNYIDGCPKVFMQCAGYRFRDTVKDVGQYGWYWSSSSFNYNDNDYQEVAALNLQLPHVGDNTVDNRSPCYYGASVRCVQE